MPVHRLLLPATIATAVAGGAAALLLAGATASATPTTPVFAVQKHRAAAADRLSDRRVSIAAIAQQMPELIPSGARVVNATAERSFAIVPRSDGQICLAQSTADGAGGYACQPDDVAARQGLAFTGPGSGAGVVPAGVKSVAFTLSDGSSVTVPADANGFYHAPAEATSGSIVVDGVASEIEFVPLSALPKNAEVRPNGDIVIRGEAR